MNKASQPLEHSGNRKDTLPIKVFCNPDEKQAITNNAYRSGMSVSHYLRAVALGKSNTPIRNLRLTDELIKTKVELGRILGSLKLCLDRIETIPLDSKVWFRETVSSLIRDIEVNQASLKVLIQRAISS